MFVSNYPRHRYEQTPGLPKWNELRNDTADIIISEIDNAIQIRRHETRIIGRTFRRLSTGIAGFGVSEELLGDKIPFEPRTYIAAVAAVGCLAILDRFKAIRAEDNTIKAIHAEAVQHTQDECV